MQLNSLLVAGGRRFSLPDRPELLVMERHNLYLNNRMTISFMGTVSVFGRFASVNFKGYGARRPSRTGF